MKKSSETFLPIENKNEGEELVKLLEGFTPEERKELLTFAQGFKFARTIQSEKTA